MCDSGVLHIEIHVHVHVHYRWLFVITMAVLYNYFLIIVRETFHQLNDVVLPLWLLLDYVADVVYLVDMFVQLFTSERLNTASTKMLSMVPVLSI